MRSTIFLLIFFTMYFQCVSQARFDSVLIGILEIKADSVLLKVLNNKEEYKCQLIYTQIIRDKHNVPSFQNFYYNVDSKNYYNPASTVKLPLAILALEKLNDLNQPGINKFTAVLFDSAYEGQVKEHTDSTSETGLPSIAQFIRKAFIVSDNDAYNRLYEFVGQATINNRLHEAGYPATRITRRFMGFTLEQNRRNNPVRFLNANGRVIYRQPMVVNTDSFDFSEIHKMGNAHYNRSGQLVNTPIDFTTHNNLPLEDLQQMLQSTMFPGSVPLSHRFRLKEEDYKFIYQYLSQYPSETNYPLYDTAKYYDSYVKFFFRAGSRKIPSYIRVFNKVGWAYGCMTDVSYIVDFKNKVEYMITATIYVNKDGILNDDKYEYETIALPFFYRVNQAIYDFELNRERKYKPVLDRFKIKYDVRNETGRKPIVEVDN